MLAIGKQLTDETGRITVRRVLSVESGSARVETTFESAGYLGDIHYTDLGTLWSVIRSDGTLYGEWKGGLRSDSNDTAVYRGITGGAYLDETLHSRVYRGALTFENATGAFAELNSNLAVFEAVLDDDGKVTYRTWALGGQA
jgi:hypothetical protein